MDGTTPPGDPASGPLAAWELRAWRRLRAGMRVELGLADRSSAKAWQAAVRGAAFDADRCADDLLAHDPKHPEQEEQRLVERSARLQRDLLMAPLLRGVSGAARATRGAVRSGVAALVMQLIVLLIFATLTFLFLLVARFKGVEFDGFFDSVLDLLPAISTEATP